MSLVAEALPNTELAFQERAAMESETPAIPKINFSGDVLEGTAGWAAVQAEVMRALFTYGSFEALYDGVPPEILETLFDRAMPEFFSLPIDIKKHAKHSDLPYQGYTNLFPEFDYENISVEERDVEEFTRLMWPHRNLSFCDTITAYISRLKELEQMIVKMIFDSLGIVNYYESYIESTEYEVRLAGYGLPIYQEKVSLPPHFDKNFITVICQHRVRGLEIQTKEGEWIHVVPSPNSYTVLIGDAFQAWSNGRLQATCHRVKAISNEKRNSLLFLSWPKKSQLIVAPKELVDEEHPLLYKPYTIEDYFKFSFGDGGPKTLKDFAVGGEEVQV